MHLLLCMVLLLIIAHVVAVDVNALLDSMTLEEKVGQMTQLDITMFVNQDTGVVDYDAMRDFMNITKVRYMPVYIVFVRYFNIHIFI